MDLPHEPVSVGAAGTLRPRTRTRRRERRELTGFQAQFGLDFASHSTLQEFYFGPDLLLERHDYRVDIAGGFSAIQYISDLVEADGIRVPTKRRAYRCDEDGRPILSEVMVSIDLSDVRFS